MLPFPLFLVCSLSPPRHSAAAAHLRHSFTCSREVTSTSSICTPRLFLSPTGCSLFPPNPTPRIPRHRYVIFLRKWAEGRKTNILCRVTGNIKFDRAEREQLHVACKVGFRGNLCQGSAQSGSVCQQVGQGCSNRWRNCLVLC